MELKMQLAELDAQGARFHSLTPKYMNIWMPLNSWSELGRPVSVTVVVNAERAQ